MLRKDRRHRTTPVVVLVVALALSTTGCAGGSASADRSVERTGTSTTGPTGKASSTSTIDPYGDDPIVVSGTRDDVCRGGASADRAGRARLASHIDATWPAVLIVRGYECREILDPAHADCDREVEPERSTCWSTHAAGRAIDVVVGGEPDAPSVDGAALGDEIVTAFLRNENGVDHRLARITGVQEIIWNGHCWYPDDSGVTTSAAMPACPIAGHSDHVHLTLSDAGADGLTSWYR